MILPQSHHSGTDPKPDHSNSRLIPGHRQTGRVAKPDSRQTGRVELATAELATIRPEFESPSIRLDERIGLFSPTELGLMRATGDNWNSNSLFGNPRQSR
jgi:hypothetical protein